MPTPHNEAKIGDIANTVLMPGDPLRAEFIAHTFLENVVCYNHVRNMLGFTGTYHGKKVSVQGSGMGVPSIGIYSYELFHHYDVDNIIRIGSAGSMHPDVHLYDIVLAQGACTNSAYANNFDLPGIFAPIADFSLLFRAKQSADLMGMTAHVGNVLTSDYFYETYPQTEKWGNMGVLAVEMESAALYMNAAQAHKSALSILTISDSLITQEETTAKERETSFTKMMELALSLL